MEKPLEFNLYEALGVPPEASLDEIKNAFKNLAKIHHPDKATGNTEEFAKISYAYRILRDPGSRLLYDNTGRTQDVDIDKEVETVILAAFSSAIDSDDMEDMMVEHARAFVRAHETNFINQKKELTARKEKLTRKRKKVKSKAKKNLFDLVVERELKSIEVGLVHIETMLGVAKGCFNVLNDYESYDNFDESPLGMLLIRKGSMGIRYAQLKGVTFDQAEGGDE